MPHKSSLTAGRAGFSKPSTIVRVKVDRGRVDLTVDRVGVYDERTVGKLARWTVVFVCSGNTCRSPMAEGFARQYLADQAGIPVDQLEDSGVAIASAGTGTLAGMPASSESVQVMDECGVNISSHRSSPLTPEMIHAADLIYCMTQGHRSAVLRLVPAAEQRTFLLDPAGDVEDPIGADLATYRTCRDKIRKHVADRLRDGDA